MSALAPLGAPTPATAGSSVPVTSAGAPPAPAADDAQGQSIDYMSLLLAQLQNQDPSSPMDATQMVAQTTQLGMLQQLTQMESDANQALTFQMRQTAASLVGLTVQYTDANGASATGVVQGVTFGTTTPTVTIGGVSLPLSSVAGVTSGAAAAGSTA
ncbi:MAG TPA: flagellar hook capping FlgD N-terminal domain-containing protein [Microbacteriaceae bacterium]|nr:flagellar hook capping FlgD N-terminal domain-containing protein [Microbacteriaceae bacterium]